MLKRIPPMTRRRFLSTAVAGGAGALCPWPVGGAPAALRGRGPNVLFIITDQQHIDTIRAAGCSEICTPGMDRLVSRGTLFTQSHSTNPLCSPARSSMFTGRPASETGVYQNNRGIRPGMPNLGQWLGQESDYEVVYAGKWHLPRGFTHDIPGFKVLNTGIGGQGNLGDTTTSMACEDYLRHRSGPRPFFLVASFLQPHDICEWLRLHQDPIGHLPYPELAEKLPPLPANFGFDANEPDSVRSRRAGNEGTRNHWTGLQWRYYIWSYYRHVEMVDAEVSRILDALDETGLANDTLVVFTSDHGEGTAHHQMTRKNSLYEEALKVPLIISWPGRLPEGRTDEDTLTSGYDIAPTICDFAGITGPPSCRGSSLRSLLEGAGGERRSFCVSEVLNNSGRMVRTPRFKYITYRDDPVEQLFDVASDPGELRNLVSDSMHADTLAAHRRLLREWESKLDVAVGVPYPSAFRGG